MIACEPNKAMAFTKARRTPDRIAGITSGVVITSAVRHLLAPKICAASS